MQDKKFLFPENPLFRRTPDIEYEEEYNEVNKYFSESLLINLENLENNKINIKFNKSEKPFCLIYRGWMISPENYEKLYNIFAEKSYFLINTPEQYKYCHMISEWYDDFADFTPFTLYTDKISDKSIDNMLEQFGTRKAIIKDYVKSRKHEWYEACYIPDCSDKKNALKIIHTFIKRQGNNLAGGLVIREYNNLKPIGFHHKSGICIFEEYRLFFLFGRLINVINYWNKTDLKCSLSNSELEYICNIAKKVKSNFFTVDIARKTNGNFIIIELGDGQVSGLQDFSAEEFYRDFSNIINLN
ncbi:MAG: ATP-grasp domain-containing protein [Oscillospiraceae bacterium]|nr:ATP-grasp domain-containing protein [Oscillospiraceae bacterium]